MNRILIINKWSLMDIGQCRINCGFRLSSLFEVLKFKIAGKMLKLELEVRLQRIVFSVIG